MPDEIQIEDPYTVNPSIKRDHLNTLYDANRKNMKILRKNERFVGKHLCFSRQNNNLLNVFPRN